MDLRTSFAVLQAIQVQIFFLLTILCPRYIKYQNIDNLLLKVNILQREFFIILKL